MIVTRLFSKGKKSIFLILTFFFCNSFAGHTDIDAYPHPQNKPYFEKNGFYQIITEYSKHNFEPGDTLKIGIYITGYGMFKGSKLYIAVPSDIIDMEESYISAGMYQTSSKQLLYGCNVFKVKDFQHNTMTFGESLITARWSANQLVIDMNLDSGDLTIFGEKHLQQAPIVYNIIIKEKAKSGDYNIPMAFTYFNGDCWAGEKELIEIHIPNFIETYTFLPWLIGIIGGLAVIEPVISSISNLLSRFNKKNKKIKTVIRKTR